MKRIGLALAALAGAAAALAGEPEEFRPTLDLSGWVQLDYRRAGPAGDEPDHELTPRRLRVRLGGLAAPRVAYAVVLEGDNAVSGSAGVLDAWASFRFSEWLRADFGQFKYDFDLIGRESPTETVLNDKPFVTNAVAGGLDGTSTPATTSSRFRDRGLALAGEVGSGALEVRYSAGLFQGAGRGSDDDGSVTGVVRVQLSPAGTPLLVSGGFLAGATGAPGGGSEAGAETGPGDYRAWTAGAVWDTPRFYARAEYYDAERERGGLVQHLDGFYAVGVVTAVRQLDLALRYQRLEDAAAVSTGALSSVDLGAEWFLLRRGRNGGTSVAANLMLRDAPDGALLTGLTLLNDGRGAAVSTGAELGTAFSFRVQIEF